MLKDSYLHLQFGQLLFSAWEGHAFFDAGESCQTLGRGSCSILAEFLLAPKALLNTELCDAIAGRFVEGMQKQTDSATFSGSGGCKPWRVVVSHDMSHDCRL